jgi:hypothetical protein
MTRELSAIIKDYVETKKSLDYYSNINSNDESAWYIKQHFEILTDRYEKELEHKVLAIYNGIC